MIQLDVSIMGQGYRLACREGEEKMLREAVAYLDEKMCSIRDGGKIKGNDRIAVMASLAIAAELLATNRRMVLCPKCRCPKSGRKWRR